MLRKAVVIGLGKFGREVAVNLGGRGYSVLALDVDLERVNALSRHVESAMVLDATDESALEGVNLDEMGVAVCAIGEKALENSILCTALLKQFNVPRIIARSHNPLHERILRLVGATEVVNPEKEMGIRLAGRIASPGIVEMIPLAEGVSFSEIMVPESFVGQSLTTLDIRKRHQVNVVAVRRPRPGQSISEGRLIINPDPSEALKSGDILVVVGQDTHIERINRLG